jgi:hypothetical protein
MNEELYSKILDSLAQEEMQGVDVAPRVLARIQKGISSKMKPQTKLAMAVLLALVVLVVLFFTMPGVATAIKRWFGYVPGVGLVSEGQVRVLEEPVTVTREGITVSVELGLVDAQHTTLVYTVSGIPAGLEFNVTDPAACRKTPSLRLPGGSLLEYPGGSSEGNGTTFKYHYEFSSLPADVNDAVLVMPCVDGANSLGVLPEDWEIPLHFIPAPPDMTTFPVIELASTPATPGRYGMNLVLDRVVPLEDGYLLYTTLDYENTNFYGVSPLPDASLVDPQGRRIPLTVYETVQFQSADDRRSTIVYKTGNIDGPGPYTIEWERVSVSIPADARFSFDPGQDVQPGKTWKLDRDIRVGEYSMRILSAHYTVQDGVSGLYFQVQSDSGIEFASITDPDQAQATGAGGSYTPGTGTGPQYFTTGFNYLNGLPDGPITLSVNSVSVTLTGPWQTTWDLSDSPADVAPSPHGISLAIDRAAVMGDRYVLYGRLRWQGAEVADAFIPSIDRMRLVDARGLEVEIAGFDWQSENQALVMEITTGAVDQAGPLTLVVDSVDANLPAEGSFDFDPGVDPQPGQVWSIDRAVQAGSYRLHILQAAVDSSGKRLTFDVTSDPEALNAIFFDSEHETLGSEHGYAEKPGEPFHVSIVYRDGVPSGQIKIAISTVLVTLDGPWQADLTLPAPQANAPLPTLNADVSPHPGNAIDLAPLDLRLTVDSAEQVEGGYILQAVYHYTGDGIIAVTDGSSFSAHLLDPTGREIPLESMQVNRVASATESPAAYRTAGIYSPGPYTLRVDSVVVTRVADAVFTFDVGPDPQLGQTWQVDQEILVGGIPLRLTGARYIEDNGLDSLVFDVRAPEGVVCVMGEDVGHPDRSVGATCATSGGSSFTLGYGYNASIPAGPHRLKISSVQVHQKGPYDATWTPPVLTPGQPTPEPSACLTRTAWLQALSRRPAIPAGVTGRLARAIPVNETGADLSIVGLDGSLLRPIGRGFAGAFSLDGLRFVYSTADGLAVIELASGRTSTLPATTGRDFGPLWSPDSTRMAFSRFDGVPALYVMPAGGGELRQLATAAQGMIAPFGWMPDGRLLYSLSDLAPATSIRRVDVDSGEDVLLFTIDGYAYNITLSPDGSRMAYSKTEFGFRNRLYLAGLDGAIRQVLSNGDLMISGATWSPDGNWLALSLGEYDAGDALPVLALVNPGTCEIIPLPAMTGYFNSWAP